MVKYILKSIGAMLKQKPVSLWGFSLLYLLIAILIDSCGAFVPIIAIPLTLMLTAGMSFMYLNAYDGKSVSAPMLFEGFKREKAYKTLGGMSWYALWLLIWSYIPVINVIKMYSYSFTPYILMTRPEISATEALHLSKMETKGYKLVMFLLDLIICVIPFGICAALAITGILTELVILTVITSILLIAILLFVPLVRGIAFAAIYRETKKGSFTAAVYTPAAFNPNAPGLTNTNVSEDDWTCECGTQNPQGTRFCRACGKEYK